MVRIKTSTEADLANMMFCDGLGHDGVCKSVPASPSALLQRSDLLECNLCRNLRSPRLAPEHLRGTYVTAADLMAFANLRNPDPKLVSPDLNLAKAKSELNAIYDRAEWKNDETLAHEAGMLDLIKIVVASQADESNKWDTSSACEALVNATTLNEVFAERDQYIEACKEDIKHWEKEEATAKARIKDAARIRDFTDAPPKKKRRGQGFSRKKGSRRR